MSTQDDSYCWSSDDAAKRRECKFVRARFSEESNSCRSMDVDGSVKRGRSKAMSIIQTPAADMAYQQLSEQILHMQDILDKRLTMLEESNASTSIKLDTLAKSNDVLLRMFRQVRPHTKRKRVKSYQSSVNCRSEGSNVQESKNLRKESEQRHKVMGVAESARKSIKCESHDGRRKRSSESSNIGHVDNPTNPDPKQEVENNFILRESSSNEDEC